MRDITVKSAIPLSQEQKQRLEQGIAAKSDDVLSFSYTVDKSVMGGIVVVDGEKYLDASFASALLSVKKLGKSFISDMHGKTNNIGAEEMSKLLTEKLRKAFSPSGEESAPLLGGAFSKLSGETSIVKCGRVENIADGVVQISGVSDCKNGELLQIGNDTFAIAMNLEPSVVGAMLVNATDGVDIGDIVYTTGRIAEVPVGEPLLGRVINPIGQPVDGKGALYADKFRKLEAPAPTIIDREKVNSPLYTGVLAVDAMVPIGKGQRELIIGDRQTGKSSLAIDTILNQRGKNVFCVYVAIGQRAGIIAGTVQTLKDFGAMDYTVVVASGADDPAPLQYLAPYAGCAIAEEFMYGGKDVLIVYDDLSKHAVAYRAISLLLKRPAGREAYPGDIFYVHSRLLERAAKLSKALGGGSMTALPIIETQEGDISAYIPTNVISITDGQIYFEKELFRSGIRPAINVGLSVSRVGGSAQCKAIRKLSGQLRLDLAHHRELSVFSQFGSELDEGTKKILVQGEKATEALKQPVNRPISALQEIVYLYLITNGHLAEVKTPKIGHFIKDFFEYYRGSFSEEAKRIETSLTLDEEAEKAILEALAQFKSYYKDKR